MNKVKKDLVMQDLISLLPFGKKEQQQQPYIKKRKEMEVDSTSFEEVTRILWAKSMEKENDS